jgi:lipoate-protein ligase A
MAVDEGLLEEAIQGATTLRLYQWSEATLSLGYFQSAADRQLHAASRDCPLVRRASGGGAIVHDRELTYCLATPIAERFGRAARQLFSTVHAAIVESLAEFGVKSHVFEPRPQSSPAAASYTKSEPFLCFERLAPGDLLVGSAKIAGSAQRRQRGGLVQHGSILLAASEKAAEVPGIREVAGVELSAAELGQRLGRELARRMDLAWTVAALSEAQRQRALALERERFASDTWTFRR